MGESRRSLSEIFGEPEKGSAGRAAADAGFGDGVAELFQRIDEDRARLLEAEVPEADPGPADPGTDAGPADPGTSDPEPDAELDTASRPGAGLRPRPNRRRVIAAAAAAVGAGLAIAGVIAVTGQQASEAGEAKVLEALSAAEATLLDSERMLDGAHRRFADALAAGAGEADRADAMLASLAGLSDEAARTTALSAVTTYRQGLQELAPPDLPAPYEPSDDDSGADEAAEALDLVRARQEAVDDLLGEIAVKESELLTLGAALTTAREAFLTGIPAFAEALNAENTRAEEQFRASVTAAAASVAAPGADDSAVQAYVAAVAALRADEARAAEEARLREQEDPDPERRPTPTPTPDPAQPPPPAPLPTPPPPAPTPVPTEPPPPPAE